MLKIHIYVHRHWQCGLVLSGMGLITMAGIQIIIGFNSFYFIEKKGNIIGSRHGLARTDLAINDNCDYFDKITDKRIPYMFYFCFCFCFG